MILILIIVLFFNIPSVYAETAGEDLQSGNDFFDQGNFDQAISEYTKAIDINPNYAKAYDNRGVAYAKEGSLSRAIADFTMAIANNFNDAEAYNKRGHAYDNQGNLTQAVFDYSQAIRINPLYAKAYNNRSLAYYNLKEYDKAWRDVHKIEELKDTVSPDFIDELKKASGKNQ
jgi:tetratricopeptide (TPR) repeat protein